MDCMKERKTDKKTKEPKQKHPNPTKKPTIKNKIKLQSLIRLKKRKKEKRQGCYTEDNH